MKLYIDRVEPLGTSKEPSWYHGNAGWLGLHNLSTIQRCQRTPRCSISFTTPYALPGRQMTCSSLCQVRSWSRRAYGFEAKCTYADQHQAPRSKYFLIHAGVCGQRLSRRHSYGIVYANDSVSTGEISRTRDDNDDEEEEELKPEKKKTGNAVEIALAVGCVIVTAVLNRILYKMALVPLGNYVFFLAQFQTFGYVIVYALVLLIQARKGVLAPQAFKIPATYKHLFIGIGLVEAIASLLSFIGASKLPGVMIPLLSQTILVWQVVLVYVVLRQRMSLLQLFGVGVVIAGVTAASWPSPTGAVMTTSLWSNVCVGMLLSVCLCMCIWKGKCIYE